MALGWGLTPSRSSLSIHSKISTDWTQKKNSQKNPLAHAAVGTITAPLAIMEEGVHLLRLDMAERIYVG
jgi:hypothetical protein